jgi:hypothetical protein
MSFWKKDRREENNFSSESVAVGSVAIDPLLQNGRRRGYPCTILGRPLERVWLAGSQNNEAEHRSDSPAPAADSFSQKRTRHWRRVPVQGENVGQSKSIRGSVVCRNSHTDRETAI